MLKSEEPSFVPSGTDFAYLKSPHETEDIESRVQPNCELNLPLEISSTYTGYPSLSRHVLDREVPLSPPRVLRNSRFEPDSNFQDPERQERRARRRASHKIVERRYRHNLSSKFRQLEKVVLQQADAYSASSALTSLSKQSSALSSSTSSQMPRRQQPPKSLIIDSALSVIEGLLETNHDMKQKLNSLEEQTGGSMRESSYAYHDQDRGRGS